jgi:hypothetical protein
MSEAILVTVGVVVLTYLAGKLAYRIRDVLLMIAVAAFVSLLLNSLVVTLQRWGIRSRGWAVTIVVTWLVVSTGGRSGVRKEVTQPVARCAEILRWRAVAPLTSRRLVQVCPAEQLLRCAPHRGPGAAGCDTRSPRSWPSRRRS